MRTVSYKKKEKSQLVGFHRKYLTAVNAGEMKNKQTNIRLNVDTAFKLNPPPRKVVLPLWPSAVAATAAVAAVCCNTVISGAAAAPGRGVEQHTQGNVFRPRWVS